jgi:hypothetical protein
VHIGSEERTGVSSYTGEGRHLGGIIGIPWPGSEDTAAIQDVDIYEYIRVYTYIRVCTVGHFSIYTV